MSALLNCISCTSQQVLIGFFILSEWRYVATWFAWSIDWKWWAGSRRHCLFGVQSRDVSGETTENHGDLESRRRYWNVGSPEYAAYALDKYVRFLRPLLLSPAYRQTHSSGGRSGNWDRFSLALHLSPSFQYCSMRIRSSQQVLYDFSIGQRRKNNTL
jgi:hypothetical protein